MDWDTGELRALAADLGKASASATRKASQVVRKATLDVEARSKAYAPVDTGALMNSIASTFSDAGLSGVVGPTVNYGGYVELGTSRMAPQPYMGPALADVEPGFIAAITDLGGEVLQ